MKFKLSKWVVCIGCVLSVFLTGCTEMEPAETMDLQRISLKVITQNAREEGKFISVDMPDDWANWKDDWAAVTGQYGLVHGDMDMSAAEELPLFETENEADTKDIGDERQAFGPTTAEMGVVQPCKASTCNSIPDWTKDPDGNWTIPFVSIMRCL